MTPEDLSLAIRDALIATAEGGQFALTIPDQIRVERPRQKGHGDWSTNIALQLAKSAGANPRELAAALATRLESTDGIAAVEVAGPGFINVTLDAASAGELARSIVDAGENYGHNDSMAGQRINLEFVSANPTGPLHLGHTRWAALGDAMHRLLLASGAQADAEYYINDAGAQMDNFAASVLAAMRGEPTPEGGYPGEYIQDLAQQITSEHPDLAAGAASDPSPQVREEIRELAYQAQLASIKDTLTRFGVHFDTYFSEAGLHNSNALAEAVQRLREQGHAFDLDGATWLRTTDFGDDKDRVLLRANGEPTYFAADAAYYLSKKDRGYEQKIYLLGADHHGYIARLKAIAACAGDDPATNIDVRIGQLVNLNGAKLSKRAGNIVELDDLINWIGADAVRYSLARYPADSPLSLNGEDLRKQTNDNPVYTVQYAHARTANVARLAAADGVNRDDAFDASLLVDPTEAALLAALGDFPRVVAHAASLLEPHRVARYLEELASRYHRWYDNCRVRPLNDQEAVSDLHRTRLWLNDATGQVLRNGLSLLGVSAPERM